MSKLKTRFGQTYQKRVEAAYERAARINRVPPEQGARANRPRKMTQWESDKYRKDPRTIDPKRDRVYRDLRDQASEDRLRHKMGELVRDLAEDVPIVRIGDLIDGFIRTRETALQHPVPNSLNGWTLGAQCNGPQLAVRTYRTAGSGGPTHAWVGQVNNCLTGQAGLSATLPALTTQQSLLVGTRNASGGNSRLFRYYYRLSTATNMAPDFVTTQRSHWFQEGLLKNPNVVRFTRGEAPAQQPQPTPTVAATALPSASRLAWGPPPASPTGNRFAGRRPPDRYTREGKTMARSAQVAIAVFSVLDKISEGCEIVDAFFSSLPDKTQKRWSRGREDRPWIDSAGQYGLDGCDWKSQALWHNWHLVDPDKAWRNILQNVLEDRVIGDVNRVRPKNVVNAMEESDKALAEVLAAIFKESGLSPE